METSHEKVRIEPGMRVEATEGDLGEHDIRPAVVKEVNRDDTGQVEEVVVEKGAIFKKDIVVAADRIAAIDPGPPDEAASGTVHIIASESEIDDLAAVGTETLPTPTPDPAKDGLAPGDLLGQLEEEIPSAEGLARMEGRNAEKVAASASSPNRLQSMLHSLGPGFLAGMAGNDASAVTSYSVNGATNGYGQLWLMLLSTPMFQAVQFACGKIGRVTQKGLSVILHEQYGQKVAVGAALVLIISNIALVAGDLVAIGSGLELITSIPWIWFVLPAALFLWYVTVS